MMNPAVYTCGVKIYSWNIYFRNHLFERALEFIQSHEFDVFCLQEVTDAFLEKVRKLPYFIAVGADIDRLFPDGVDRNHLVIISKHPIVEARPFEMPIPHAPLRRRAFVRIMHFLGWSKIENNGGLWAKVIAPGFPGGMQIFSLHILLSYPKARAAEFERVMEERVCGIPAVVCGDFNIIDSPRLSILNWILGGTILDALLWWRERLDMEERFKTHGLVNPLRGRVTHPLSHSQLDHILVSNKLTIARADVLMEKPGSDHRPIRVDISV